MNEGVKGTSAWSWALTGATFVAGLFGTVTLDEAYKGLSFLVMLLTAISLMVKIHKQLRNKNCDE
jgi:hypothetical protein